MSPFVYKRSRILTAITLYPFVYFVFLKTTALMDLLKIEYLSALGVATYFGIMLLLAVFYLLVNEEFICRKEP